MREFLAIVEDTWRQSRQQVVFIILVVLLAIVSVVMVAYPKVIVGDDGEEQFGLQFIDAPVTWVAEAWEETALQTRILASDERALAFDTEKKAERTALEERERKKLDVEAAEITPLRRSVEFWSWIAAQVVFSLSMLLFIGASAAYYPDLLAAGAVDVVLAKPLSRLQVFLGKYLGGLVLYAGLITATYAVIAAGLGLRTGVWPVGLLQVIPIQLFSAAVLYAIVALFGVLSRSTALAVIMGYVFYLVIDTAISSAASVQQVGLSESIPLLDRALSIAHYLPSFGFLKEIAVNSCIDVQPFDTWPLMVASVWLLITLSLAYWKFHRTDF